MKKLGFIFLFMALLLTGYSQSDTLYLKSNTKVPCKIIEIGESEIRYKTPDNLEGPSYLISLSKVYMYVLSNGTSVYSRSDTLYVKGGKKIPCLVTEIGDSDIKYRTADNPDGPVYLIPLTSVYKYSLSDGTTKQVMPDELLIENQHTEIINNRSVIKIHPFSFVNDQISVAYEQVIKMGTNLDVEAGYINNGITPSNNYNSNFYTTSGKPASISGFYLKPGIKFLLGQDYSTKGMRYAHPLKGRYFRVEVVFSYMNYQDVANQLSYSQTYPVWPNTSYTTTTTNRVADINVLGYGGLISYGRQFILGNVMTLDYFISAGVTGQGHNYTNEKITTNTYVYDPNNPTPYPPQYYYSGDAKYINNFHAFFRSPDLGLSGAFGLRLGFIVPEKKPMPKVD